MPPQLNSNTSSATLTSEDSAMGSRPQGCAFRFAMLTSTTSTKASTARCAAAYGSTGRKEGAMSDTPQTDEAQFGTGRVSVDFARQLERELAAVTEQRDGLKQAVDCANDLLASVTEHRDKEREIYQKSYSAELARSNHYKEQRDRLAEAIRKHKETLPFAPPPCDKKLYEALAAVEGGNQ